MGKKAGCHSGQWGFSVAAQETSRRGMGASVVGPTWNAGAPFTQVIPENDLKMSRMEEKKESKKEGEEKSQK